MLNQLVESKSYKAENKKRGGYLLTTFVLVVGLLFSAVLWSLFAKDLGIGRDGFELSTIVAPLPLTANAPEQMPKEPKREQTQKTKSAIITRQINMLRIDESPIAPDKTSAAPNTQKSRPDAPFLIKDNVDETGIENLPQSDMGRRTGGKSIGDTQNTQTARTENVADAPPPPIKKAVAESAEKKKITISTGVVNGQATVLPKPLYPLAARAIHAEGNVNVQVLIDEIGRVISARAIDGNILLRASAEKAAFGARFSPTLLSNQPVRVTGVIVYKFSNQ